MAAITIEVDDEFLDEAVRVEGTTDERGRLNLGSDHGGMEVEAIIVEAKQASSSEGQSDD